MKKKWIIIGVIVLVVLLIGINIWKQNSKTNLEVETATLKEETMSETVMTPGTLTLEKEQYIYFQAEKGEIDEILVAEGDTVSEGDNLLRYENKQLALDKQQNDLQIRTAYLELEKLRKEHKEIDKEVDKDPDNELLQEEHDQIKLQEQLASIEVEQANLQKETIDSELESLIITADVEGTILSVDEQASSAGEMSEQSIIRIGSLNNVIVEGTISEYDTLNIKKDQKVKLTSDAVPDEEWEGKVTFIGDLPEEDSSMGMESEDASVLYPIRVEVEEDIELKPGFKMLLEIITNEEKAKTLPIASVQQEDDNNYVYIVENGKAKRVDVKVGSVDTEKIEIKEGIEKDDQVIITNISDVSSGMEVTVK